MKNRRNIVEQKYPPENPNDIWLKDGKFYRSTSEGWVVVDLKTEYTSKESMIADNPKGGTIGIDKKTGEASIYNDVAKQWSPLSGGITKTIWQELKDKRDAGELTPGSLYRITDYNCTTTQENTRSAGHQFDIVLLALSEDKLAEEGWAMEHPTDVYDVTFSDGVTKKCYLYEYNIYPEDNVMHYTWNIIDIETRLGFKADDIYLPSEGITIDRINKTIVFGPLIADSTSLTEENLPYNYFQNSNLSAWKVWYCLDNDTARFAWADDRKYIIDASNIKCYRNLDEDITVDNVNLYGWVGTDINGNSVTHWTDTENPQTGDITYDDTHYYDGRLIEIGVSGKGVIYRLIDEFNNDVAYDFKNIQYVRKFTDGHYDAQGTDTWVYTFNAYDEDEHSYFDATLGKLYSNDENGARYISNIKIFSVQQYSTVYSVTDGTAKQILNDVVFFDVVSSGSYTYTSFNVTLYEVARCTYTNFRDAIILRQCDKAFNFPPNSSIVNNNRQVVWEDIS